MLISNKNKITEIDIKNLVEFIKGLETQAAQAKQRYSQMEAKIQANIQNHQKKTAEYKEQLNQLVK